MSEMLNLAQKYEIKAVDSVEVSDEEITVTSQQMELVRKFIIICGFKGLADYTTKFTAKKITPEMMQKLSLLANDISAAFPSHEINLRRTDGKFSTATQVMSVLRTLLTYIGVRWRSGRTKNSIYIMLLCDDICAYDCALIKHIERVKGAVDCQPLKFVIDRDAVTYICSRPFLVLRSEKNADWLKLNTKKLKIVDCPAEIIGNQYFVLFGGCISYHGKIDKKNVYPCKYLDFTTMAYHEIAILFDLSGLINPITAALTITMEVTPFINPSVPSASNEMLEYPWIYPNCVLRMFSGVAGTTRTPEYCDTRVQEYTKYIQNGTLSYRNVPMQCVNGLSVKTELRENVYRVKDFEWLFCPDVHNMQVDYLELRYRVVTSQSSIMLDIHNHNKDIYKIAVYHDGKEVKPPINVIIIDQMTRKQSSSPFIQEQLTSLPQVELTEPFTWVHYIMYIEIADIEPSTYFVDVTYKSKDKIL